MKNKILYILLLMCCLVSCSTNDDVSYVPDKATYSDDEIDVFFQQNFQDKYGCAVRWKWVDKYVDINYVVAPAFRKVLIPTGQMLQRFWIEPFILESKASGEFIRKNFPPEIVCVGSELRNADGTRTLGYADAGVRITLTELNYYDLSNRDWIIQQLHTIHHEFSHIVHQTYKMPTGFNEISEKNYTGEAWNDMYTQAEMQLMNAGLSNPNRQQVDSVAQNMAIKRGMLTPYGTASEFEDFAEIVSIYLLTEPAVFNATYLAEDPNREFLNEGKAMIEKKVDMVKEYYMSHFSIDLSHLRSIILGRLNEIKTK
jgi:substrate import-associated zinc metallohydrolase lipoprotein